MTTTPTRPRATPSTPPTAGRTDERQWVGRGVDRRDGPAKVHGDALYTADRPFPGLTHGWMVHAPHARARIVAIDTAAARAHPGVVDVVTHDNAPRMAPPPSASLLDLSSLASRSRVEYLNTDQVHYDGQPVAVVVAESLETARYAASLVRVDYEVLPATTDFRAARDTATRAKQTPAAPTVSGTKGDAVASLDASPVVVELGLTTPAHHHSAMEPHVTTAHWDGDRLTVWDPTQGIDWCRKHLARRFGVDVRQVRVLAPVIGGGFGGKGSVWAGTLLTVLAARHVERPVRMALSREAVTRTVGARTPTMQRVALGADRDGRLRSVVHEAVVRSSTVGGGSEQVVAVSTALYATPALRVGTEVVELDMLPNTFMRAPGDATGSFGLESAMDQLAHDVSLDPVELRLRNDTDRTPLHGRRFSHRRVPDLMELGSREFGWAERGPGGRRDGDRLVGHGMALAYHPALTFEAHVVLRATAAGRVVLRTSAQDMGMGIATVLAQVVADELAVPLDRVGVEYGDSDQPIAPPAGGSTQTASLTAATVRAAERLRSRVQRLGPSAAGSVLDAVRAHGQDVEVVVGHDEGLRARAGTLRWIAETLWGQRRWQRAAWGAHFCEVAVDADTGEVRVTRWVGAFDIGAVLNAKTAASQLRGGIVMGLGLALTEESVTDARTGRLVGPDLTHYHVPSHADVPEIGIHLLGDPDPTAPRGVVGAGEVGITGVGAAVANAVFDATGRRLTHLPLTPDRVLGLAPEA
ncbi:xanthine dehydrogenase family protein molybdopterin-binding subunit [Phycicoccus sp. CSK15P-2]|uniref:xanthine dehydrogenase family protein molybdopterin-binding subunit n=1 Tax=Phycicoccus sp. CSK15P-2 TaxID=2807627 RepID=UPI00194E9D47|nr:xanthine dehydrogenase family protein molybdopterin-binding subunit [Phycicoccus sp. CSK15P-2]MBM6404173.1 xanthine dehydrogenase family protein molybdopterin-binding subunit [Phycicoccus sp. CSK15P-2]